MSDKTLRVYNERSVELAEYFRGHGSRVHDIELAFQLAGKEDGTADVLEIGCGDGRDAAEIIPRSRSYVGIDYSKGMLDLARELLPSGNFQVTDMQTFEYGSENYDIVFAFASILHVDLEATGMVIKDVAKTLRPGGIFYISSKYAGEYTEKWQEDKFGKRLFYFYNAEILGEMSDKWFEVAATSRNAKGKSPWFQIALRKK